MSIEAEISLCCTLAQGGGAVGNGYMQVPMSGLYSVSATLATNNGPGPPIQQWRTNDNADDLNTGGVTAIPWTNNSMSCAYPGFEWDLADPTIIRALYQGTARFRVQLLAENGGVPNDDVVSVFMRKNGVTVLQGNDLLTFATDTQATCGFDVLDPGVGVGHEYQVLTTANNPVIGPVKLLTPGPLCPHTWVSAERLTLGRVTYSMRVYDLNDNPLYATAAKTVAIGQDDVSLANVAVMIPAGGKLRLWMSTDELALPSIGTANAELVKVGPYMDLASCEGGE